MTTTPTHPRGEPRKTPGLQADFSAWVLATSDPSALQLGEAGFSYPDLFAPERLAELTARFDAFFREADPAAHAVFSAYRDTKGKGMKPEAVSEALLAAAPHVSRFIARLFGVEQEIGALIERAKENSSLWHFKKEF